MDLLITPHTLNMSVHAVTEDGLSLTATGVYVVFIYFTQRSLLLDKS